MNDPSKLELVHVPEEISIKDDSTDTLGVNIEETPAEKRFRWVFVTGVWILGVVGLVMIASTIMYGIQYNRIIALEPNIPINTTPEMTKQILENFKILNDIRLNAAQNFFDNTVVKVFLPIFTTVLGVVLGIRIGETESKD